MALAKNDVLTRMAEPAVRKARTLSKAASQTAHVYGEGRYAAASWKGRLGTRLHSIVLDDACRTMGRVLTPLLRR